MGVIRDRWRAYARQQILDQLALTWLRGDHSMKALLRGGFTRNQATLLKEI